MDFKVKKEDWRKIGVYRITNTINNKIYIGSTTTNFRHRFLQYRSGFIRKIDNQPILYRAFNKYGFESFNFEIVCISNKEDTIKMEQFYIDKGTDYNSCLIAGSLSGLIHSCHSKTRTIVGGLHHSSKVVFQFSKKGQLIQKHNSIIEALKSLGKTKNGSSHITQSCKGITFSAFGYRWSFTNKVTERESRKGRHRIKISKDDFSKEFTSHQEVVKYFNSIGFEKVRQGAISNAITLNNKLYNYKIKRICVTT